MDIGRKVPDDGTLAKLSRVPSDTDIVKTNVMLIKVPEHLRNQGDPMFHLATVDRSIPGDDLSGNQILDKLFPDLPKVTLFEEPKPKVDTPSPEKFVQRKEFIRPRPASSNTGGKSRSFYYKKYSIERSNRPNADEISPWIPGNEPYIPHGSRRMPTIPLIAKTGPQLVEYPLKPVDFGDGPPENYSGGFDDGPPENYSGGFDDGPPSNYAGEFDDGPPPNYSGGFSDGLLPLPIYQSSTGSHPYPKYNNHIRRPFQRCNPNSRGGRPVNKVHQKVNPREDTNPNQRFQRNNNLRKNNYSLRGRFLNERSTFEERSSVAQGWITNEMLGPSTCHKARGKTYESNKRRAIYRIPQKPFTRRGKQNYR